MSLDLILLAVMLLAALGTAAYHLWLQMPDDEFYERERARRRHPSTRPPSNRRCHVRRPAHRKEQS